MGYRASKGDARVELFETVEDPPAVGSLIFARIIYAINWLNIGPLFVLMSPDLGVGLPALGTLTSAFYLGVGPMQIPGGLLAAKWGPKKVVTIGIFLSSVSALATAFLSSVGAIAVLRFFVGTGMAFVFAPGVVLVSRLFRGGKSGMGVGLFNSAYNFGGLLGIFGWIVVAEASGWRQGIALGGTLGIISGFLVLLYVPGDRVGAESRVNPTTLLRIIKDTPLFLLGLGTLGFGIGNVVISVFMTKYLVDALALPSVAAALIAGMVVFVPIFTAIWGGRIYDRSKRPRRLMAVSLTGMAAALLFGAVPNIVSALACSVVGGVVSGIGFTIAFAGARDIHSFGEAFDGVTIGWVNTISLTGSFFPPLIFTYLKELSGYPYAWLGSALLCLAFLAPLLLLKEWMVR